MSLLRDFQNQNYMNNYFNKMKDLMLIILNNYYKIIYIKVKKWIFKYIYKYKKNN